MNAIFDDKIPKDSLSLEVDPVFGFHFPSYIIGDSVKAEVLNPKLSWADRDAYDVQRLALAEKFKNNFKKLQHDQTCGSRFDYSIYGPR